ncbi:hypothetical protein HanPI659440_Chr02g0090741 [Helianthus annuus]|nr:hypothetical protein HanPI659440_Chr02g0090741 [Helianthus annuus]
MVRDLCAVKMGDYRLKANVARFLYEEGEIGQPPTTNKRPEYREEQVNRKAEDFKTGPSSFTHGRRSFKETLTGIHKKVDSGKVVKIDDDLDILQNLVGFALVMRFVDLLTLKKVNLILKEMDAGESRVQYLGGLSVLVSFKQKEDAERIFLLAKEDASNFTSVSRWEGQSIAFERLAWIKIKGIPVHLLDDSVIDKVAESFGKIMHRPPRSVEDADLSSEFIGVLVGEGKRITEEVTISWRDRKFKVWVDEESGDWVPEFIEVNQDNGCDMEEDGSDQEGEEDRDSNSEEEDDGVEEVAGKDAGHIPVVGEGETFNVDPPLSVDNLETGSGSLKGADFKEGN